MMGAQLVLVTATADETQIKTMLTKLQQSIRGATIRRIGTFPSGIRNPLTERQKEVLGGIAIGKSVKEIAVQLGISPKTLESHRTGIMQRTGIQNVPGLVRYALQTGAIPAAWLAKRD
jgi:DNA-binding CsgD family transcriptional regulator